MSPTIKMWQKRLGWIISEKHLAIGTPIFAFLSGCILVTSLMFAFNSEPKQKPINTEINIGTVTNLIDSSPKSEQLCLKYQATAMLAESRTGQLTYDQWKTIERKCETP